MPKIKKGFKVDRIKAKRDPAQLRKGKRGEAAAKAAKAAEANKPAVARPKTIKFDTDAMKDYVTGFHVRKNQRRLQAMRKVRDDHRAQVNNERKEKREERRKIYNQISQFPINEEYKLELPGGDEDSAEEGFEETTTARVRRSRETYSGAEAGTEVDVEVGELDLSAGLASASTRVKRKNYDSDEDSEAEEEPAAPNAFPSTQRLANSNPFAAMAAAQTQKVRLIRKK